MNEFEIVTLIERPVKEVFAVLEDVTKPGHKCQSPGPTLRGAEPGRNISLQRSHTPPSVTTSFCRSCTTSAVDDR